MTVLEEASTSSFLSASMLEKISVSCDGALGQEKGLKDELSKVMRGACHVCSAWHVAQMCCDIVTDPRKDRRTENQEGILQPGGER